MKISRRRNLLYASLLFLIFTLLAAAVTLQLYLATQETKYPINIYGQFLVELALWLPWAILTPFIFQTEKRIRIARGRWYVKTAYHLAAAAAFVAVYTLISQMIVKGLKPILEAAQSRLPVMITRSVFDMRLLGYGAILGAALAWDYYRQYRDRDLAAAELKIQLAQAQLQTLKSQIHPHFLFNTLNTVSALVHEDPDAADRIIGRLSELLRLTLESSGRQEVPLKEEIDVLGIYLDILETRFGERISFRVEINPASSGVLVPSFLLQPLVENAVRHGMASRREGGLVAIRAARHGETLLIKVTDNGPGFSADPESLVRQGFGLANVRERLKLLYGRDGSMILENAGGASVKISIPIRPGKDAGQHA
jgi:two-component system LytT family sensor kinase